MIIIRRTHKAGSTNRLAGFGLEFDKSVYDSWYDSYRDRSKEWVNASEQVTPPPNKYRLARSLGMAANVAILGSFAHRYFTRRRQTKNGKIIVERVKKQRVKKR